MRATDEQLRAALFSDDVARRSLAARHIETARQELFPLMLEVLRESRPVERHDHLHHSATRMIRDEAMLDAYLEVLPLVRERWQKGEMYLDDPLSQIVRDVPPALLLARHNQLRPLCQDPYGISVCQLRAGWLRRKPETSLRAIETFGRKHADHRGSLPAGGDGLEYAAEGAARDVELSRAWFGDRLERLSVLPEESPQGDLFWIAHVAVDLAGHAGLREAAPLMLNCLALEDDLLFESCHHALRRLMDADLLALMDERFAEAPLWTRRSCASIAADRPLPQSAEFLARWLDISYDGDELGAIASAAVHLLDASLLPAVERVVINADWDMIYSDLAGDYLAACAILGVEPERPERIQRARAKAQRRRDRVFGNLRPIMADPPELTRPAIPPTVPVNRIKAGPNDPCLCGSGRKFKKCCMNKLAIGG